MLSKYKYGFRIGFNSQYYLPSMTDKWQKALSNGCFFGVLLTDLYKKFDCLCMLMAYRVPLWSHYGPGFQFFYFCSVPLRFH